MPRGAGRPLSAPIDVVAAALFDRHGRALIARRPAGKWQAGRWEFPGGKVESGEDEQVALQRELREELGVQVEVVRRLGETTHAYADRSVRLILWLVLRYQGEPQGLEGQELRWVGTQDLAAADMLEADLPLLGLLRDLPVSG